MSAEDRRALVALLTSFRYRGGTRVVQHLLYHDLHELVVWCDAHPETVSRSA